MRETWVDDVKVFACILVALGHFFQSMVTAGILVETALYRWFNETIYYFHVPLFFLCSGYLYQKNTGEGVRWSWQKNVIQKGVTLGVPYVVFSLATWLLKEVFSGSVNSQNAGLMRTLLLEPASPYWYLYTLFFIFLVLPRVSSCKMALVFTGGSVLLKGLRIYGLANTGIYCIDSVMDNAIWFVFGMLLRFMPADGQNPKSVLLTAGMISAAAFTAMSLWIAAADIRYTVVSTFMGFWGCTGVILVLKNWTVGKYRRRVADLMATYTMPVFLMHTIFAAGLRAVFLKMGIFNAAVHVIFGITISFVGPVVAFIIMEHLRLDFLIYPGKYISKLRNKGI